MTLDEAIQHCEKVAEKAEADVNYINLFGETPDELGRTLVSCIRCANEHRQLAEWLKELKERREAEESEGKPFKPTFGEKDRREY